MLIFKQISVTLALIALLVGGVWAENEKGGDQRLTLSGMLKDAGNGEVLLGATIYIKELKSGTSTNMDGFFSIDLAQGEYTFEFSYIGYETVEKVIKLEHDLTISIELSSGEEVIQEVEIRSTSSNSNVSRSEMSTIKIKMKEIRQIPALCGEVDIIKAIQLLPGVQSTSEGSSGFSVRGGSTDQNLILLDEAPVYNASHLLGFFSVFNNDVIKDVKLYKGNLPAETGGRLSSLLDVQLKEGNSKKLSVSGGLGTISSKLAFDGPIGNNTSFILAGRRTYADVFLPLASDESIRNNKLYFYDFNARIATKLNNNNRIYLSGFYANDVINTETYLMDFINATASFKWNHLFSDKLYSNLIATYTNYTYTVGRPFEGVSLFEWKSDLKDITAKMDFGWIPNSNHKVKFGVQSTWHEFMPAETNDFSNDEFFNTFKMPANNAVENAVYFSHEQKIGGLLTLKYGLRASSFTNVGEAIFYQFDKTDPNNYEVVGEDVYEDGDIINTYWGLEPRLGMKLQLSEKSSVKASYSRTRQYVHLAQNSTAGSPLDLWFPSSPNVKPQIADQYSLGVFRNFANDCIEASAEIYYKQMENTIDFRDNAVLMMNKELEGEFRFGSSESYGIELMTRFNCNKLNGWFSYTYSHTERTIPEINNGEPYLAPYDKPHDISVVLNYNIYKRVSISGNWVYSTGSPVTFPVGRAEVNGGIMPIYSDRNDYRMPDYHRLDLAITIKGKQRPGKKWYGEWNFSCYNVYGRKNAWAISFLQDEQNPGSTYAEMTYLFSYVPSISYNFKF